MEREAAECHRILTAPLLQTLEPPSSKHPGLDSIRERDDGNFLPSSLTLGVGWR